MRVLVLLLLLTALAWADSRWSIAVHGGAGADPAMMSPEDIQATEAGLQKAVKLGAKLLAEGRPSLEVVEQVVRVLEDDPHFNAGKGAALNAQGFAELDASIMDGRTLAGGAVAALKTVKNPVSLARLVMQKTPHVLLMGEGAEQFATQMGVERVDNKYFWTERAQRSLDKKLKKKHGTVGCAALDQQGNLAAATSTGGLTGKLWGRIGDSPILGAGTYADNRTCAVSCTGTGEEFIRNAIAYDVSARMRYGGMTLKQAIDNAIYKTLKPDVGGMIGVDREGNIVMELNTAGMSRAAADWKGRMEWKIGK